MSTTVDDDDVIAAEIARLRPRIYRRFENKVKLNADSPLAQPHEYIRQLCPIDDPNEIPLFIPLLHRR